jgi:transposase
VAFREVDVIEVREVLRAWLAGQGLRTAAQRAGVDRKTARRYVQAAQEAGLARDGGQAQLSDGLIGQVVQQVRPARSGGHGAAWQVLEAEQPQIAAWVKQDLTVAKVAILLQRRGVRVPYRTLHRFCVLRAAVRVWPTASRCGWPTASPVLSVSSTLPAWGCWPTRRRAVAG